MKRSIFVLVGILMVASLLLTACGGTVEPPAMTDEPGTTEPVVTDEMAPEPVTITIWHQWGGTYLDSISDVFTEYMMRHPEVTIDLSKPDDVTAALQVAIPAGEGPDILGWANDKIGTQALAGNIVALDDYGIDMAFLESLYEPAAIAGVVYQGMIWALPESQEGLAFVYNKALVDPAVDLPTDPQDFAGLLAKAQAFYEAKGIPLFCNQGFSNSDAYNVAPLFFSYGVPAFVDDQGVAYLNTPEAIAAGQWLVDVKPFLMEEMSYDLCNTALAEGKVGAWWTGPWAIAGIESAGIDYGIAAMGSPFVGIKTLMVTTNAVDRGHAEVALDIIKFFTSYEMQKYMSLANKTIPANTEALNDPEVQALTTVAGFGLALNQGTPMSNSPYADAQWGPVGDAVVAIWNGSQTPEEALAAAQAALEAKIAEMK